MPSIRWCFLALALLLLDAREAQACSCVGSLATTGSAFQVWPPRGLVPRDAHLWVRRGPTARGEIALFAGKKRLPSEVRPVTDPIFEVIPAGPLPESFEVRAGEEGSWTTLASLQSSPALVSKLPAGGALQQVDTRDGDPWEICGNGSPRATLVFEPFAAEPAGKPVPYAVWFRLGSSPLDLSRPPDRLIFVEGQELKVDGGSICVQGDFWLPTGEGEARLAAAAIAADGTRQAPREVTFRAALTAKEQEQLRERCLARHEEERRQMHQQVSTTEEMLRGHERHARRALWAATVLGVLGAALLGAALRRRKGRGLVVGSAVSLALGATAALVSAHHDRQLHLWMARRDAQPRTGDGTRCSQQFPRDPRPPPRR